MAVAGRGNFGDADPLTIVAYPTVILIRTAYAPRYMSSPYSRGGHPSGSAISTGRRRIPRKLVVVSLAAL